MKELSLFTGMGGGIYGSLILGWQTVAYVERNGYCRKIIKQRIKDGWFENGEIYGDIKTFNKKHARKYTDKIDILTGGFPCQPFSVAGKRKGASDERYLFDQIIETIKIVRPKQCFFENVRGLLTDPTIIDIYKQLGELGYTVKPALLLGSHDCGNIHQRKRVWILADATEQFCHVAESQPAEHQKQQKSQLRNGNQQYDVTDTKCGRRSEILCCKTKCCEKSLSTNETTSCDTHACLQSPHTNSQRREGKWKKKVQRQPILQRRENIRSIEDIIQRPDIPEPLLWRVDDELSDWKQRLKAIGNGQDPIVMATAYQLLELLP